MTLAPTRGWPEVLGEPRDEWLQAIRANARICEPFRERAEYDTGTVPEASAVALRALCEWFRPREVVEIGTFIGTSAFAILGCKSVKRLFTCDKDNACLESQGRLMVYPKTRSTLMLRKLASEVRKIDLFFFDGRIQPADIESIVGLSKPETVYAFDDYEGHEKGVINADLLAPVFPAHRLIPPPADVWGLDSRSTVAVLVP